MGAIATGKQLHYGRPVLWFWLIYKHAVYCQLKIPLGKGGVIYNKSAGSGNLIGFKFFKNLVKPWVHFVTFKRLQSFIFHTLTITYFSVLNKAFPASLKIIQ